MWTSDHMQTHWVPIPKFSSVFHLIRSQFTEMLEEDTLG